MNFDLPRERVALAMRAHNDLIRCGAPLESVLSANELIAACAVDAKPKPKPKPRPKPSGY